MARLDSARLDFDLLRIMAEAYRLRLMGGLEDELSAWGYSLIAGVDEAGRGCLAGPVVAAAVLVDQRRLVPGIDDSKRLDEEARERLLPAIEDAALAVGWAARSAAVIDRVNVLEATKEAMLEALDRLEIKPEIAVVDAVPLKARCRVLPLARADSLSYAVASASIVAKCQRDRLMNELDRSYPQYGLASNKGYGAARHRKALEELGPTPIHRLTFRSVVPRSKEPRLSRVGPEASSSQLAAR